MEYGLTEPAELGATQLSDGRRLGWAAWGPADGMPVLFFSGAAMGRSLGFGADLLAPLGIRLITLDRPGLGASDSAAGRTLADWPRDVAEFAAAEGHAGFRIVGFSQGAPFALACAAAGLPAAVAVVSGGDELAAPDLADLLVPEVRRMVGSVAADPVAFEASMADAVDADLLWRLVVDGSSELDRHVYQTPAFAEFYSRSLAEGFTQGAAGYTRDLVLHLSRWPFDPADIVVPVDLWYGGQDASPVHSPDRGALLSRRIPTARRHLLPEAGGSLLWTHTEDVLTALRSW